MTGSHSSQQDRRRSLQFLPTSLTSRDYAQTQPRRWLNERIVSPPHNGSCDGSDDDSNDYSDHESDNDSDNDRWSVKANPSV